MVSFITWPAVLLYQPSPGGDFSCNDMPAHLPVNASTQPLPRNDSTEQRLLWQLASLVAEGQGLFGVDWFEDTEAHTGRWCAFQAVTQCVISSLSYGSGGSNVTPQNVTLTAGDRLQGDIRGFTLTSGTACLYRSATQA